MAHLLRTLPRLQANTLSPSQINIAYEILGFVASVMAKMPEVRYTEERVREIVSEWVIDNRDKTKGLNDKQHFNLFMLALDLIVLYIKTVNNPKERN